MSTIKTNAILDASGGNTTTINGATPTAYNTMGKNRIINGAMEIDQRNAGASGTLAHGSLTYAVDRWNVYENTPVTNSTYQQVSDAPANFSYSLKYTNGTAGGSATSTQNARIQQRIEGYNFADLMYGTSDARTITISFWVKSSLTGTYCVALHNSTTLESYVTEYAINSANTWEQKTVTIPGNTSGTWLTTNEIGLSVGFTLSCGSARTTSTADTWTSGQIYQATSNQIDFTATTGATFYLTGVQLEVGSVATEFERRPYGTELALCQRYCVVISGAGTTASSSPVASGYCVGTTNFYVPYVFKVTPRTPPTGISVTNPTSFTCAFGAASNPSAINFTGGSFEGCFMQAVITGGTGGYGGVMYMNNTNAKIEITGMEL